MRRYRDVSRLTRTLVCAAAAGTEWNGPMYLPSLNLAVVGAVDWCTSLRLVRPDSIQVRPGAPWTGAIARR